MPLNLLPVFVKPLCSFLSLGFFFPSVRLNRKQGDPTPSLETVHQLAQFTAIYQKKKNKERKEKKKQLKASSP